MQATGSPRASSSRSNREPMKPVPPMIRVDMGFLRVLRIDYGAGDRISTRWRAGRWSGKLRRE
jgi:hypothetical protein